MDEIDFFTINIEQTNWQTSENILKAIRENVFVEEQQVPLDLEVDEHDDQATHWVAYNAEGQAIGTARLISDGHIGRMAVLKEFRNKGVGSAILRQIIRLAKQLPLNQLTLDAQSQAVPFYENFGFETRGKEFVEAGIAHIGMTLAIEQKNHPTTNAELPVIDDQQRQHKPIDGLEVFLVRARKMAQKTDRCIRVFTHKMSPEIYSDKPLCDAFFQLASRHPNAEIKVLLNDNHLMKTQRIGLAELTQKLSSHVFVRQLNKRIKSLHNEFLVFDDTSIIYQQELRRFVGYSVDYAPTEALQLIEDFDQMWEQSNPDSEARRLHI